VGQVGLDSGSALGKDRRDEETRAEHELASDEVGGVVGGELEEEGSDDRRAKVVGVEEEGVEVGREDVAGGEGGAGVGLAEKTAGFWSTAWLFWLPRMG